METDSEKQTPFTKLLVIVVVVAIVVYGLSFLFKNKTSSVSQNQVAQDKVSEVVPDNINETQNNNMNELKIEDIVVGTGAEAVEGSLVSVNYIGKFVDGRIFDTNNVDAAKEAGVYIPAREYSAFEFTLGAGQVIAGWDQGVKGMKVGGKRTLSIPPELAYGPNDYGPIPGNSTLEFEVELLGVK